MFDAQYLMAGVYVSTTFVRTDLFSPWMPRVADNCIISLETIAHSANGVASVQLYHKNSEDVGPGAAVDGTSPIVRTTPGISWGECGAVKELVRYKIICTSTGAPQSVDDYVLLRLLEMSWFNAVGV